MNEVVTKISLKYRLEYAGFLIADTIFSALPIEWASAISGFIWRKIAPHLFRHVRAQANLSRAYPTMAVREREKILAGMWDNLGRTFAEAFHLRKLAMGNRITILQPELFEKISNSKIGAVFCLAHLANWEITAAALLHHKLDSAGVYQEIHNPLVDAYVHRTRAFLYRGGLWSKEDNSVRRMIRFARQGGSACIMTDLHVLNGIKIDFFGTPAATSPFPAILALQLKIPLHVMTIRRDAGVRFSIALTEIATTLSGDRDADILTLTQAIHSHLEQHIRQYPDQWMWGQKRWG